MSLSVERVGFRDERQSRKFQAAGDDQGKLYAACWMLSKSLSIVDGTDISELD